jgi:CheY-like chemotaxis protein
MARILLVDDHHDSAVELTRDLTVEGGHEIVHARSGPAAVKILEAKNNGIDLVLAEASMGGDREAGFTLSRAIRQMGSRVPVVIHSMVSSEETRLNEMRDASLASGANAFILKGSIDPLLSVIDRQLAGRAR